MNETLSENDSNFSRTEAPINKYMNIPQMEIKSIATTEAVSRRLGVISKPPVFL